MTVGMRGISWWMLLTPNHDVNSRCGLQIGGNRGWGCRRCSVTEEWRSSQAFSFLSRYCRLQSTRRRPCCKQGWHRRAACMWVGLCYKGADSVSFIQNMMTTSWPQYDTVQCAQDTHKELDTYLHSKFYKYPDHTALCRVVVMMLSSHFRCNGMVSNKSCLEGWRWRPILKTNHNSNF